MGKLNSKATLRLRSAGFTLIELMIAIVVAAILLGIGIPSFSNFILNNRMTSSANDMLAALHTARSEAIKRRSSIVFCFSTNPEADEPNCDGDGTQGWIVFVDDADPSTAAATDNNGEADLGAGETVVLRQGSPPQIQIKSTPSTSKGYVAYNGAGIARELAALGMNSDMTGIVMCDSRGNTEFGGAGVSAARGLSISTTGRPSVTRLVAAITALGGCP